MVATRKTNLCPHTSRCRVIPGHDQHLKSFDTIAELVVFAGETLVLLLEVGNVLCGLAQDGGLVELVRWRKAAKVLVESILKTLGLVLL